MLTRTARLLAAVPAAILLTAASAAPSAAPADTAYRDLETFMSVYERVKNNYVQDVDDHTLIKGAIDGMLNALDPHSSYAEEADYVDLTTLSNGNYAGIGVITTVEDGAMKVVSTNEDTPAWRAGIKSGDFITRVDGKLVYGLSLDEGIEKLRGAPGSKVELSIFRPGRPKPLKLTMVREMIDVKPVKWEVKDKVGIVNLNRFTGNSAVEVGSALAAIDRETKGGAIGYVLDLRSNGGGVLEQAVEIADLFLNSGEIVSQRGRDAGEARHYYAKPGDVTNGRPVLVLVDAGTASASEIVAGALQEHRRALVVGERSFGKGSVQSIYNLGPKQALRLTTELYYLPSGRSVQAGGIEPDIVIPQLSDEDYRSRPEVREADLRRHLIAEGAEDVQLYEDDDGKDPRFSYTAAELKKLGIKDFQLEYSVNTLKRIETAGLADPPAAAPSRV